VWKFVVHNMIMRKRALGQSRYYVDHQLGDPHMTVADLQERSCAEFYWPPLRRLIEQYILETTGETVNLLEDSNARFMAVQENTHLVVSYFDMCTRSYHENVVRPVFGVSDYWYRYEFAKSRGQINRHQLSWREDRQPHELLHQAVQEECQKPEKVRRLNEWVEENFAMSASHPAGKDEDGEPRKEFWLPPEVTAQPVSEDDDPLVRMLTDDIIAIVDYVCAYACKGNEPTGAAKDLFKDMVNAVDSADEVSGRSVCARMLMKTVGRRDVSGPEASFELSGLPLWRCTRQFFYLSMKGSRRLERNGDTATSSTALDKYLARPCDEVCSWYQFASKREKVPVVSGGSTHSTWPLQKDICRTMMLLHWPNWFRLDELKSADESWKDAFSRYVITDQCPMFVKALVVKASRQAEGAREPTYESDGEDEPADAEEQPDWVDIYAGPNQTYEGVEEFQYDDGGENFDWSSSTIVIPETADPKVWLVNQIEESDNAEDGELMLPDVSPITLNEEQRSIVSLILLTLKKYLEQADDYVPLRLVVSGTGGTGKSYMIKCMQRLVRQLFGKNDAVQVVTPTGNAAFLVQGNTAHSFLSLPTGGRACNELTVPADTPTYIPDSRNAPSNHARLVWTMFDSAAELTQIIRQAESERQLREVLMSLRTYTTTTEQVHWLQQFQWQNLQRTHGNGLLQRMDEEGLFVFATHRLEWGRNKTKMLECNSLPGHPVAKIKAENHGHHAQKADSNKAGGLLPRLYLCRDSKVMLVANLKATWGLFNGAVGRVVDIVYLNGRRPTDDPPPLPDYGMNPGALFVALSRAKSAGGEGADPDFAFHGDVLVNEDTRTTRARTFEMERLRQLSAQCRQRRDYAPAYKRSTFLELVRFRLCIQAKYSGRSLLICSGVEPDEPANDMLAGFFRDVEGLEVKPLLCVCFKGTDDERAGCKPIVGSYERKNRRIIQCKSTIRCGSHLSRRP
ncbi:predicted protein, partial [Nematostella vectensis]